MAVILKRQYCWQVYRYEIVLDTQHIQVGSIWKKKEYLGLLTQRIAALNQQQVTYLRCTGK